MYLRGNSDSSYWTRITIKNFLKCDNIYLTTSQVYLNQDYSTRIFYQPLMIWILVCQINYNIVPVLKKVMRHFYLVINKVLAITCEEYFAISCQVCPFSFLINASSKDQESPWPSSLLTPTTSLGISKTTRRFENLLEKLPELRKAIILIIFITGRGYRLKVTEGSVTESRVWSPQGAELLVFPSGWSGADSAYFS